MTWFLQLCRAAWDRFDTWATRRIERLDAKDAAEASWTDELREDAEPDLSHKLRYKGGRHRRMPDEPVRKEAS
jgi:hypothetical protein